MRSNFTPFEAASRGEIRALQEQKLLGLLRKVSGNPFYRRKYEECGINLERVRSLDDLKMLPFTYKRDFQKDQTENPPFGANLSEPLENYVRYHQTTGTTGLPLKWLDTKESWEWRGKCAAMSLWASGVRPSDVVFFPFAFGPHVAFWGLFEGTFQIGALAIAGGGWNTVQRLRSLIENQATVVCCTPTYALRMAEAAVDNDIDLRKSSVRLLIHAGEPGGLIPSIQKKISDAWGATPYDYPGLTEVGAYALHCEHQRTAIHVNETEFILEVIDPTTGKPLEDGNMGEMVLTNLGRTSSPGIRFRTHDLVRVSTAQCGCGRTFRLLEGGVLGRSDDMIIVRGMNLFPSDLGNVVEGCLVIGEEYQIIAYTKDGMGEVKVCVEPGKGRDPAQLCKRLEGALRERFEIRIPVEAVPLNTLPRSDYKSKRFVDKRAAS
ncbi:MAG: phenylacetate--CoA ligase family protein [Desulfobacteraceae bacterium]|nr:MAG: phenylacetate--CoA ligase family protein [Desulfobacteraceae bacterium]